MTRSILVVGRDPESTTQLASLLRSRAHIDAVEARTSDEAMQLAGSAPRTAAVLLGGDEPFLHLADRVATEYALPCILILPAQCDGPDVKMHEAIMAALIAPVSADQLGLAIDVASRRFQDLMALRREAETLRRSIDDRKTIERAKGLLMELTALSEREAYARIRTKSMDTQRPMVEIARAIILAYEMNGEAAAPLVKR